ncbi:hypothetical protein EVAR_98481_1 [Eumeta japonica]|uniref:Uncharacterized protein n=1 Tax=Eumeta variegata TaxID=151549 RepID=A0A4C1YHY4_EUMVA|nr:hypothetical protein EVAR_98481_1 [Eumeta japonica]
MQLADRQTNRMTDGKQRFSHRMSLRRPLEEDALPQTITARRFETRAEYLRGPEEFAKTLNTRPRARRAASSHVMNASQADRASLSLIPRSRLHARLRRNVTMSHAFSCVQPAFIDL